MFQNRIKQVKYDQNFVSVTNVQECNIGIGPMNMALNTVLPCHPKYCYQKQKCTLVKPKWENTEVGTNAHSR